MTRAALMWMLLLPAVAGAQSMDGGAADAGHAVSSGLDYTDPAAHDAPITCMAGDLERHPGQSLGQVFGDAWPVPPANAATRERATVDRWGKLVMPAGLAPRDVTVVVATLVGADGEPQRAEPICATASGFDTAAARTVMRSRFTPARFDGAATVGATVVVVRYGRSAGVQGTGRRH
ncbi:energy transducer TonB [Cognatilysobacter lacus]|uniref:TonB C-terminal domain-containing protein n=1 Tax=Cognatilysobacter lacus TaxID=1643323 RepID=A0A5D8Z5J4_9GAMM|nr:hypothetical protein [Lysobacter lacus]TZF89920.1 hypothetical protein FW784_07365 [Lysobacter lacus]